MIRQAIIPLAGLGTRLMPLTSVYPKELLPINGKIGLEYILEECVNAGIKVIGLTAGGHWHEGRDEQELLDAGAFTVTNDYIKVKKIIESN